MNQQGAHRYEDRLLEFAYGELPATEARSIEAHVKGCARCSGALQEIQGVRHQMSQLAPEPAPDAGLESLFAYAEQAARRVQAGPAPARGIRRWIFGVVGAASLAAVLVVVGVVSNDPAMKAVSPEAIKQAAAKEQLRAGESVAAPAAQAQAPAADPVPAAAPLAGDTASTTQPLAEDKNDDANLEGQGAQEKAPEPEAKVGKAVGTDYVQRVDVSSSEDLKRVAKNEAKDNAKYRENDRFDTMQNMVPGRGTVPVLPTTSTPGYARKSAPQPADGEMMLSPDTSTAERKASKKKGVQKAPWSAPMAGSGGGIDTGGVGRVGAKSDDQSAFGGPAGASTGSIGGVARPSTPPAKDLPARQAGEVADDGLKQQVVREQAKLETPRRRDGDEELQKATRSKSSRMEEESAPVESSESSSKKSVATRAPPSVAPTPAPAAAAAAESRVMNRGASAGPLSLNAPPPQVVAAAPAPAAPVSKVYSPNAQELFNAATRARPGSAEEISGLMSALSAGLAGQYRIDALQRLCTRLEDQRDDRAASYCSAWARLDPGSEVARKRAQEAEVRLSSRKAKAAKSATLDSAEPAPAKMPSRPADAAVKE